MSPNAPTYSGRLTDGNTIRVQIHQTHATATGRTVILACAMDELPTFYTVATRDQTGVWSFRTPDLTHRQMQTWHAHQVEATPCPQLLAEWLTDTTTAHQAKHAAATQTQPNGDAQSDMEAVGLQPMAVAAGL